MVRTAWKNKEAMAEFPTEIYSFTKKFVELQKLRQRADYALDDNPEDPYYETRVLALITTAASAIEQFVQADVQHRRNFVAYVLFKARPGP